MTEESCNAAGDYNVVAQLQGAGSFDISKHINFTDLYLNYPLYIVVLLSSQLPAFHP